MLWFRFGVLSNIYDKRICVPIVKLEEDYSRNVAYLEKSLEGEYGTKTIDSLEEFLDNTKIRRKSHE